MAASGFSYDSTFGFPDRNGFRLGVADVVPRWNDAGASPIPLDEAPFAWMDRALSKYRRIERPATWSEDALQLAATARAVGGLWVGLWHPNLTPALADRHHSGAAVLGVAANTFHQGARFELLEGAGHGAGRDAGGGGKIGDGRAFAVG